MSALSAFKLLIKAPCPPGRKTSCPFSFLKGRFSDVTAIVSVFLS